MTEPAFWTRPREVLLVLFLVLGTGLRLADLGGVPLDDRESIEALAAARAAGEGVSAEAAGVGAGSAAYLAGTGAIFAALGSSDATARILPAVAGAMLMLVPWLLRKRLGEPGALASTLLIAISPSLTAVSRTAGGASLGVASVALGATVLVLAGDGDLPPRRAGWLVALCLAFALGSGSAFVHGGVVLAAAALLAFRADGFGGEVWKKAWGAARPAWIPGAILALALALGLGQIPGGASTVAEGFRQWVAGWLSPATLPVLTPMGIAVAYEPAVLAFGIAGFLSARKRSDPLLRALGWAAAAALLLAVVYPGRSGEMVAWFTLPAAILAGPEIAVSLRVRPTSDEGRIGLGYAGLLLILVIYAGLQTSAYVGGIAPAANPMIPEARLAIAAGAVVVAVVAAILIGVGWSWPAVRGGGGLAAALLLTGMTISAAWGLNHSEARAGARELWRASGPTSGLPRLASTIAALSRATRTGPDRLPLRIEGDAPPSLAWTLRAVPRFAGSDTGVAEIPPLVLRPQAMEAGLPGEYLGQTFTLAERWDFAGSFPPDLAGWYWRRRIPVTPSIWVLYVRSDIAGLTGPAGAP